MSDIESLQGRITAALDRIGSGVADLGKASLGASGGDKVTELQSQLDQERATNSQLEERVKALRDRQDTTIAQLEVRVDKQATAVAELDAQLHRLRASNADLSEMNAKLRSAAEAGAVSPELINRATIAEVEALAAQRSADVAEMDAIISQLKPLIEEA